MGARGMGGGEDLTVVRAAPPAWRLPALHAGLGGSHKQPVSLDLAMSMEFKRGPKETPLQK